jgi:CBS domain-containing protein
MHVTELLDRKGRDVVTIHEGASIAAAVALMSERGVGALVVTGIDPPLSGILSERDIVCRLAETGPWVIEETVESLMTRTVTVCHETTSCATLMEIMTDQRIRHIPVIEGGLLVGIVSIGDVVKARVDELEREKSDLLEYVSAR